jgi:SAM-dependent methyltransferase
MASAELARWRETTGRDDPTLLLMGVTPELCTLPRDSGSRLLAVDRSLEMIRSVWPGPLQPGDRALCGAWNHLPLASASIDLALADGCLTNLSFPQGHAEVFAEVLRLLAPGGRWVTRAFVQAEEPETVERVLSDLGAGRVGGFHAFKWRLAMALQKDVETGVPVSSVHDALLAAEPDLDALATRCGWRPEEVRTIEAYAGIATRYAFPTTSQLRTLLESVGFTVHDVVRPSYELGRRCPVFVLQTGDGSVPSA